MVEESVESNNVQGLIGSAGKSLALDRHADEHLKRLESLDSADDFRDFLENAPLGMAERSRKEFIDSVTADPERWRDHASRLAYSVDMQIAEFRDANA